jgi:multimeric flavodoxin WrbA
LKPGAAVVSARRSGTTAAFDEINKYFTIAQMPIVSSCYWNNVHGRKAADVEEDREGMMVMRTLGRNMAWLLKSIEAGKKVGLPLPVQEERAITDFIR